MKLKMESSDISRNLEINTSLTENNEEKTAPDSPADNHFMVDRTCIPTVSQNEQEEELFELNVEVYKQEVLEKEILHQVDKAFESQRQKRTAELIQKEKKAQKQTKETVGKNRNEDEEKKEEKDDFKLVLPEETEKERKIRMGEMTPFGTVMPLKTQGSSFENIEEYLKKQLEMQKQRNEVKRKRKLQEFKTAEKPLKSKNLVLKKKIFFPKKRRKKETLGSETSNNIMDFEKSPGKLQSEVTPMDISSDSEYIPESDSDDADFELKSKTSGRKNLKKKVKKTSNEEMPDASDVEFSDEDIYSSRSFKGKKEVDDGIDTNYLLRLEEWEKHNSRDEIELQTRSLGDGFKVPMILWNKLYNYQRVGVQWLWELNLQRCGGILGDEMGLGKTIQVISFLASLSVSKLISRHGSFRGLGPVLIVCPTTVMHQWVREFHQWWPQFRVALLHESGTFKGKRQSLIRDIAKANGILITSYVTCIQQSNDLLRYTWHYVVLDEGHKIRNPDSQIASTVKLFRTPHRLILSGSPMQNNLRELWSLFDFIFPGKLGTLPVFMAEFAVPITQGGYANASKVQVATAYKCATVLRDTISPYLLRRVKEDVKSHINLPPKNEQVLFCRLTDEQKELYLSYLNSGRVDDILSGKYKVFVGLIELRKICNHPHLFTGGPKLFKWDEPESVPEEERFGYWKKAGKMIVIEALLKLWKRQGHRVLIFTQSRQMLKILEAFVQSQNYEYIKMDGATNIGSRQPLINKFNEDRKYYVFLSTTHVGGLGVNLTGANRVVIYDPDWNPATDTQARERAWRIGQENQVTIYRLVTSGTIEEKIYHRQIFKQFLTNKVLKDPSQRRFFKSNDLYELFTYKDSEGANETSAIFAGTGLEVNLKNLTHRQKVQKIRSKMTLEKRSVKKAVDARNILTKEKIEKMKEMAQILSKKIALEVSGKSIEGREDEKNPTSENVSTKEKNLSTERQTEERRKRKKKKKRDATFEGEVISHLQKQKQYRDMVKEATNHENNDDYILKKLFSKSGVHSALKHDQIMEDGSADYVLVEGEAERVAKEAVKALKESRKHCLRAFDEPSPQVSKPRFGRKTFGQRPPPGSDNGDGKNAPMTSAELLQRIRQRNGLCPVVSNIPSNPLTEHSELLADIRNFISFGGERESKATTQEIVDRFRDRLPAGQTPLFKALLQEICEFHRSSSGEGVWELRPEFRWVVYVNTERPRDKMENSKKGKDSSVQKESVSDSFKSQVGECLSFWLLRGPPFDQRDYMMSPSETPSAVSSEPVSESLKKKKLGPSDIKIDSKYLIDSQKALKKISELIKDESVEHLVDRIEDLINFFLQGSPLGFLVEDLPTVIEIVEFFARNRGSVPKFGDFVKTIMSYASEPPKVGKTSDMLNCKQALTDYFTLFAELLATFEDECFQLHLLEALDCLIIRRKLVDVCSVKLSFCHEAMEDSQLPCVVGSLMETVPASLYLHYLELSLQMVWVSIKTGYLMAEIGVVEFVICRMEELPSTEEDALPKQKEKELSEQYRLLDKSAYLIWSLFAISSKYNARIPAPSKQALWKLKCLFHCVIQKRWQKATNVRNNLAAILTKLYAFFREESTFQQVGLVADIASLAVATEIKPHSTWLAEVEFGNSQDDCLFKEIMLLCCCLFAGNKELILTLESQKVVEGVLRLINPKTTLLWIPSQFSTLLLIGFRTLSELVPRLPDSYLSSKGNRRLLSTIKWLMGEYFDQEPLLEALKTLCIIVTCDCEPIIEDAKAQGGVQILLDVCCRLLGVTFMKLEHQDKLAKIFLTLERLFRNDRKVQEKFADSCVSISVKLFRRILADSENDSKWNSNLLVSFGGFLWEAVAWCSSSLKTFVEKSGIFLLLDFIESSFFPIQMLFLGILVDMTDEGETVAHLLTWRGKSGSGILSLLIDIWRKEEFLNKVHRTKDGLIQDVEAPLMTEEQWYLTHQVTGSHIYSPSIAEMMCSVRPKIHALYQFLQCRYYDLTQLGESTYSLQMKMIEPRYQVYIPLIEHYLALKMGEIWSEVIRDALISGVAPTSFNGEVMCTLLDEKNKWAARIKTMQEELLLKNRSGEAGEEKEFYAFLRDSRLASALEAVRELDYIARTSFKKFQKRKKMKQISQRERFLTKCRFSEGRFYHSTFLKGTNTTFSRGENIWMVSERRVTPREQIALVSPESCGDNRFEIADDI